MSSTPPDTRTISACGSLSRRTGRPLAGIYLIAVLGLLALGSCKPIFSNAESQLKGMWVRADHSSSYLWSKSLAFSVFYFDGKGNVSFELRKLWHRGWDAKEIDCFATSGSYKITDSLLEIDTSRFHERAEFQITGDELFLIQPGGTGRKSRFVKTKDYPWVIYKDTTRFVHDGKVDVSFFQGYMDSTP